MNDVPVDLNWNNPLESRASVTLEEYLSIYEKRIRQDSERLFVRDFLFPIFGSDKIKYVVPQYPFLDSTGTTRRIDFAININRTKIAFEVNGESYHAEGVIPNEVFDDNLFRQNEILNAGYKLLRFSFTQLQDARWRKYVHDEILKLLRSHVPELVSDTAITPTYLQVRALKALEFTRQRGWKKGIVVLPTGTGKTHLAALDASRIDARVLYLVHRLDILTQSLDAFSKVFPKDRIGILTGEVRENVEESRILFASKDTLRNPEVLYSFKPDEFGYIVVDEVHHGQAPSYKTILDYFNPSFFMLGLTATPDRMDRRDIFELFEYNNVFEYSLNDAIENGFLVPYDYYGLKDNIDYSNIRFNGFKYNVHDLDRELIIEARNERIFAEYVEKGKYGKALGFCCSIKHAERMAEYFSIHGIPSVAITSGVGEGRQELIERFRKNEIVAAFTVDLFNEGIDFPNVRVLMFLRPTESKTIFLQQLGRGLRLCSGKERVVIIDFIGNYKKANNIRQYLSKGKSEKKNDKSGRVEKVIYEYTPNCKVQFDVEAEQILDAQDTAEREITQADLIDAYFTLAELLGRKPSQGEINEKGEFKVSHYLNTFGSWIKFLRQIGEFTEASYHFPQGLHLGHILYILKTVRGGKLKGTNIDPEYVRMRGNLSDGRLGIYQRQTKYKLQGMMELGLILDDRTLGNDEEYVIRLTPQGVAFCDVLSPILKTTDFSFTDSEDDIPSWEMILSPQEFNVIIAKYINRNERAKHIVRAQLLNMHAVGMMLNYLFRIERKKVIEKSSIYDGFFRAPFVETYCDQNGIEGATTTGAQHRCPFLFNILEAIGVLRQSRSSIELDRFIVCKATMTLLAHESDGVITNRILTVSSHLGGKPQTFPDEELTLLKEAFGKDFLTDKYYLTEYEAIS